jgi:hypothetical protein
MQPVLSQLTAAAAAAVAVELACKRLMMAPLLEVMGRRFCQLSLVSC